VDDREIVVPGAVPIETVLRTDPLYRLLGTRLRSPWILGVVLALFALTVVVFGPATESRFIYTNF